MPCRSSFASNWGLPISGTKTRNSLLSQPVESLNKALGVNRKKQFYEEYSFKKLPLLLLTPNSCKVCSHFFTLPSFGPNYRQTPICVKFYQKRDPSDRVYTYPGPLSFWNSLPKVNSLSFIQHPSVKSRPPPVTGEIQTTQALGVQVEG